MPAFWDWLDQAFATGLVCSIKQVGDEIAAGKDELTTWAASRRGLFLPMDAGCAVNLAQLAQWANAGHFTPAAVAEFLAAADYELVAYAATYEHTVVTMEKSEPQRKSKVKIPEACVSRGVPWMTPFDMLRAEKARFILKT